MTKAPFLPGTLLSILILATVFGCASTHPSPVPEQSSLTDDVANAIRVARIHVALLDQLGADALTVRAEVQGNRATLRGDVKQRATQELAEEIALSIIGIDRVENRLRQVRSAAAAEEGRVERVARSASDEVRDAALETRVNLKLLGELGRHALGLEVEVTDGVVSLRGAVPDKERKNIALQAARDTAGVERVLDLLETER